MLSGVSLHLADSGCITSVVARDPKRINRLKEHSYIYPGKINPIVSDYSDLPRFIIDIHMAQEEMGQISLAVVWIHSQYMNSAIQLAALLNRGGNCHFVHVLGSPYLSSPNKLAALEENFMRFERIKYNPVVLGTRQDANGRERWLTHGEICENVIDTIDSGIEMDKGKVSGLEPESSI